MQGGEPEFYRVMEVCSILGICRKTFYRYAAIALIQDSQFKKEWGYENPRKRGRKVTSYQLQILKEVQDESQ